jgi:hypothetical protein
MTASQIIDKLPFKQFKSFTAYASRNKRAIIDSGYIPIPAYRTSGGTCLICGEDGRCPGWHTPEEAYKAQWEMYYAGAGAKPAGMTSVP